MRTDDEMRGEVHALWTAVFGEPPIVEAPMEILLDVLVGSLPTPAYETIRRLGVISPFAQAEAAALPGSVEAEGASA